MRDDTFCQLGARYVGGLAGALDKVTNCSASWQAHEKYGGGVGFPGDCVAGE